MAHRTTTHQAYDPRQVQEHIVETPLNEEMSKSFLEYAYSVIYARALPDARDGLKPVQRRIIYQMGQMNLNPDRPYMKSARVVGEVMGKLHPHGDSAIYEAMVRLAQPFAMRLPLVDGHGNFGSLDDGPAASRYTEARMAQAALGMNANIGENTVDFTPNYDNKLQEPTVLPAAIPNLLVNGGSGIAVGMATNMATHNLGEVVAAAKHLMHHPDATLEELMRYVPGPDWPSGGVIVGRNGIREAYETGRGALTTRSVTHIENVTARKKAIVVTELPFMVGPERVLERISEGVKNRKLEGISGAIDLTDRHNGTRLVIEIKTGFDPNAVLAQLRKHTPLEDNFASNNVAFEADVLVDGVCGALVPVGALCLLIRRQGVHTAVQAVKVPGLAVADVLVQLLGLILGRDANGINVGVDAVGQREVHDAVFAAETDRRFCRFLCQRIQARTTSAGKDHCHNFFCHSFILPFYTFPSWFGIGNGLTM